MNEAQRLFQKARRTGAASDWEAAAEAAEGAELPALAAKAREMAKAATRRGEEGR